MADDTTARGGGRDGRRRRCSTAEPSGLGLRAEVSFGRGARSGPLRPLRLRPGKWRNPMSPHLLSSTTILPPATQTIMMDAILPSHRFRLFETPNTHEGGPHADVYLPTVPAPASGYPLALFWQCVPTTHLSFHLAVRPCAILTALFVVIVAAARGSSAGRGTSRSGRTGSSGSSMRASSSSRSTTGSPLMSTSRRSRMMSGGDTSLRLAEGWRRRSRGLGVRSSWMWRGWASSGPRREGTS